LQKIDKNKQYKHIKNYFVMQIKLNQNLKTPQGQLLQGTIIQINDEHGVPTDLFWRNRLKDSAIDNCIEVVDQVISTQKKGK
jgi:hypothetical protein